MDKNEIIQEIIALAQSDLRICGKSEVDFAALAHNLAERNKLFVADEGGAE